MVVTVNKIWDIEKTFMDWLFVNIDNSDMMSGLDFDETENYILNYYSKKYNLDEVEVKIFDYLLRKGINKDNIMYFELLSENRQVLDKYRNRFEWKKKWEISDSEIQIDKLVL